MRKYFAILFLFFPLISVAQISGTRPHNHSSGATGGATLTNPTIIGATISNSSLTSQNVISTSFSAGAAGFAHNANTPPNQSGGFTFANSSIVLRFMSLTGTDAFVGTCCGVATPMTIGSNGQTLRLETTGSFTSQKACAAGYTRKTPNFCMATAVGNDAFADAVGCTARSASGSNALPSDATAVLLTIYWRALSNNAVASRTNDVTFYNVAGCTQPASQSVFTMQEFVATVAGTSIAENRVMVIVPLTGTNQFSTTQANAGGNGNADILQTSAAGYFD